MSAPSPSGGWFNNLRTGFKISIVVGVVAAIAVGIAVVSLIRVRETNANLSRLSENNVVRLQLFGDIRGGQSFINNGVANLFSPEQDPTIKARNTANGKREIAQGASMVDAAVKQYTPLAKNTPAQDTVDDLATVWPVFHNGLQVYVLGGQPLPGVKLISGPQELGNMAAQMDTDVAKLATIERDDAQAVVAAGRRAYHTTLVVILIALGAGLLLAAAVAVLVVRLIVRRIHVMRDSLNQVAAGDLTVQVPVAGRDEIGEMAGALNSTVGTIHDVISQIGTDADHLSEAARRASSQGAGEQRLHLADGSMDPQETERQLAEMAENLHTMISMFNTRQASEPEPAASS